MDSSDFISKSRKITCREAESMIPRYLAGSLSDKDLAAFLNHVNNCNKCHDELETNFMVDLTVQYLNEEDPHGSFNLKPMLQKDLNEKTAALVHKHRMKKLRVVIFVLILLLAALLILDLTDVFGISEVIADLFRSAGF
ncbi:MAG: zf-HC2 domain-containing protein [Eubacterium sp.]|nr:zf-HC2 domain-containing protein [Eubacterium sp.]